MVCSGTRSLCVSVAYQGYVFNVNGDVVSCYNAKTGEQVYQERLPAASGVAPRQIKVQGEELEAGRRRSRRTRRRWPVWFANHCRWQTICAMKSGVVYVLEAKPEFKLLATNIIRVTQAVSTLHRPFRKAICFCDQERTFTASANNTTRL